MNTINKIKQKPNDIKMTPLKLAKNCINITPFHQDDILMDGCRGTGNFYNQYPEKNTKLWCEIDDGIDFFENEKKYDWLITNPAWSKITQILQKATQQAQKGIGLLIGALNLTPKRIQILNDAGFGITHIHFATVTGWLGTCAYIIAEKNKKQIVSFDRAPFQMPAEEGEQFRLKSSIYNRKYREQHKITI